jgi:small-conductance mechanosensitive channel/Arc/MetJ-type ribon-helix-helix transcriptional regulator
MAIPPIAPFGPSTVRTLRSRIFGSTRLVILLVLLMVLGACMVSAWLTRDAMANFSFLNQGRRGRSGASKKAIVNISPWQTAEALAPLAVTAEEKEFARDAERLADHDVDQAFAAALRQATLQAQHITLSGEALALSKKIAELQELIRQDQDLVQSITKELNSPSNQARDGAPAPVDSSDLDVAKAQLGLDSDRLTDAQKDLDRATGDQTAQIQAELAAHEASMQEYDKRVQSGGDVAVVSARRQGTMASRVNAWFAQRSRSELIERAIQQTQADIQAIAVAHNALELKANEGASSGSPSGSDHSTKLALIKDKAAQRQILSLYDDRIQTKQQLVTVYTKWLTQVQLQHRIVLHLILQSLALIAFIGICMVLCDGLVHRLMDKPVLDRRRSQTMQSILQLTIQVIGAVMILMVIFGTPKETPTILGLATAALTIALQDFIIAFLGWFVLIGKNGIHVGDWVEINGVGGEVIEVRLFNTTLLETGTLADRGLPTGRRITFMNGFAIRGQYFNFSTSGQWMWDEISLNLPASDNVHEWLERIQKVVVAETEKNANLAEQEWKRGAHGSTLSQFSAKAVENLRPSAAGIEVLVRYVTRASERFEMRNRLYQKLLEMLRDPGYKTDSGAATITQKE